MQASHVTANPEMVGCGDPFLDGYLLMNQTVRTEAAFYISYSRLTVAMKKALAKHIACDVELLLPAMIRHWKVMD